MTEDTATERGNGALGHRLVSNMERMTWDRIGSQSLDNARRNLRHLGDGKSIAELRGRAVKPGERAVVIAAGPSIKRQDPITEIKRAGFEGAIVVTESAIYYSLRNGVIPDLIVTLDPHSTRIVRWFGDPNLTAQRLEEDDYYRRQDMDAAFADEMRLNEELLGLLDKHGKNMRIALATSASQAVVDRVLSAGMEIYWWNPMLDDPDAADSRTMELFDLNGLPCINAGGNVGAAAWMISHAVLGRKHVALTGMDFSYYDETPYENTQYYREALELVGADKLDDLFIRIHNPHINAWFYTDPAYMWYRQSFLEMANDADCKTYNCTGGGILFGEGIEFLPLTAFLAGKY
jgi:hypothetical protein